MGNRWEINASGIDESLQGLSSDPFGGTPAVGPGLRVPALIPANGARYLFQLAAVDVDPRNSVHVIGWRQLVTIGMNVFAEAPAANLLPIELQVTSPQWHFPDGNWSFHLVAEPYFLYSNQNPVAPNFAPFRTSGAALLYGSAAFSAGNFNPATGAPYYYPVGMTAYAPPTDIIPTWEEIAGLGNVHDLRAPYRVATGWDSLDIVVKGPRRLCLYASVLQTNPATRPTPLVPSSAPIGMPPEDAFVSAYSGVAGEGTGPIIWRVGGSLILETLSEPDGN
jgi:hypothetical protein